MSEAESIRAENEALRARMRDIERLVKPKAFRSLAGRGKDRRDPRTPAMWEAERRAKETRTARRVEAALRVAIPALVALAFAGFGALVAALVLA